ncbi:type II toxin-antitoxin system VapC family toxin [Streptomyces sp. NBC_00448]|uniref:type II toxin-antitoxin system VapC family toxin n=1 Tax=Streptomyces sp. NBC_00448 TaxID=2903652 RepID=UPI002E1F6607
MPSWGASPSDHLGHRGACRRRRCRRPGPRSLRGADAPHPTPAAGPLSRAHRGLLPPGTRARHPREAAFLRSVSLGQISLIPLAAQDIDRMVELVEKYADFPLGAVDASVFAVAERLGADAIATLDRRHQRRPPQGAPLLHPAAVGQPQWPKQRGLRLRQDRGLSGRGLSSVRQLRRARMLRGRPRATIVTLHPRRDDRASAADRQPRWRVRRTATRHVCLAQPPPAPVTLSMPSRPEPADGPRRTRRRSGPAEGPALPVGSVGVPGVRAEWPVGVASGAADRSGRRSPAAGAAAARVSGAPLNQ